MIPRLQAPQTHPTRIRHVARQADRLLHHALLLMSDQEWQIWRETGGDPRIEAHYRRLQKRLTTESTENTEEGAVA